MANDTFKLDAAERVNSVLEGEQGCGLMNEYLMITAVGASWSDGRCVSSTADQYLPELGFGVELDSGAAPEHRPDIDRLPYNASSQRPPETNEEIGRIVSSGRKVMDSQSGRSEFDQTERKPTERPNHGPTEREPRSSAPREMENLSVWDLINPPPSPITSNREGPRQSSPDQNRSGQLPGGVTKDYVRPESPGTEPVRVPIR